MNCSRIFFKLSVVVARHKLRLVRLKNILLFFKRIHLKRIDDFVTARLSKDIRLKQIYDFVWNFVHIKASCMYSIELASYTFPNTIKMRFFVNIWKWKLFQIFYVLILWLFISLRLGRGLLYLAVNAVNSLCFSASSLWNLYTFYFRRNEIHPPNAWEYA